MKSTAAIIAILSLLSPSAMSKAFTDVEADHPYSAAIASLKQESVVRGYADGSFKPDKRINRAEFTKVIVEGFSWGKGNCTKSLPSDVPSQSWYAAYVCAGQERGIIMGYPDGSFRPEQAITSAEASAILARAFALSSRVTAVWYEGYMEALRTRGALPVSSRDPAHPLTRGEMAEMFDRLLLAQGTKKRILGWIPYWDQERAFASFSNHAEIIDYLGVFWYHLDAKGNIDTYMYADKDQALINQAHARGTRVLAIVANLPDDDEGGDWDQERVARMLQSPSARKEHTQALVDLTLSRNFDGINLDYEALEGDLREAFTLFCEELASALHEHGKMLGIALHAKTSETNPEEDNGSHAQDWAALGNVADHLYYMTYDEHTSGDDPGPIASLPWIETTLKYALEDIGVPPAKVFLGLPFYAQEWRRDASGWTGTEEEMTMEGADERRREHGETFDWDAMARSPSFTFNEQGKEYVIWTENARSIDEKMNLGNRYGIPNIGIWRLGGETGDVWVELEKWRAK